MNAAIRAVTRAAIANGMRVKAIYRGYEGLVNNEIKEFTTENVSNIIQRGGTILKTARSKEFMTPEGRQKAYENMRANEIDALIVIGGNGSLSGARIFAEEFDVPCIGLPGTIDNDLNGTDYQMKDVYFNFEREIMTNAADNAQIELIDAQKQQTQITTLLNLANHLDNETLMQLICEQLDLDYDDIKDKLPQPEEADPYADMNGAIDANTDGGGMIE